jgi:succinoglycan biosynthesis transport protein ExoP
MTLRQIIDVLWARRLLIVVMTVVALGAAIGYLQVRQVDYTATAVVRENVTFSQAAQTGELGGVNVDFDPSTLTTAKILGPAATSIGLSSDALLGKITSTSNAGVQTTTLNVTGTGPDAAFAQRAVTAALKQYSTYLQSQVNSAITTLTKRQSDANALAQQYQAQIFARPTDSVAQTGLTSALSSLGSVTDQLDTVKNAGAPLIIMTAAQPGVPTGPGRLTVFAVALISGLIAGIGVALIRDQFDDRVRDEREFEPLTGLRSLGELVLDRRAKRGKDLLPAAGVRPTALLEGMRAVRTSIQVLLPQKSTVVVVTSAQPGEGKSFVAANLALSLARAGKKVVLVGGDMRRPTLSRYFLDAATGDGLAALLDKSSTHSGVSAHDIDAELRSTPYAGLRILPAGDTADAVGDLLAASDLGALIGHLRSVADAVVIDSPPALTVVDASLLGKHADGVVVVAGIRTVTRDMLAGVVETLKQNNVPLLGVVANKSRRSVPRPTAAYYIKGAARQVA